MKFIPARLAGVYLVEPELHGDDRGFFARAFCEREFATAGLASHFVQTNIALSRKRGTMRGMHYQVGKAAEVKLVRCTRGALWDVVLDLRRESPTFGKWFGAELNEENRLMMYVPEGCAHGLITLRDNTEALYLVSAFYTPEQERGVRWNDPAFGITWPARPIEISVKDASWPDFAA